MKRIFGTLPTGEKIYAYTIKGNNTEAEIMTYGATILKLDAFGTDIVGGFNNFEAYIENKGCLGMTVGRVANRIKDAKFVIDGKEYNVTKNNNGNCLHGGVGFGHRVWEVKDVFENSVTFAYTSPDGEDGFPAELKAEVTYSLEDDSLIIDYKATPNGTTPISMTNHAYFNLDGFGGDIMNHTLKVFADEITEVDDKLIPTGNHPKVEGTRFDLRGGRVLGEVLDGEIYDHNFVLCPNIYSKFKNKTVALCAELENKNLRMSVYTDQPGIQIYSAHGLGSGSDFKGGIKQVKYGAICLEAQTEPNSVNLGVGVYKNGETYTQTTVYKIERKVKK